MARIVFSPDEQSFHVPDGSELKELSNLPITYGCKRGGCGVCTIKVIEGAEYLTKRSKEERETLKKKGLDKKGYRLACQCALNGTINIQRFSDKNPIK